MREQEVIRKHRKLRQNVSAFAPYIGGEDGSFELPANANLYVRSGSAVSANTEALVAGSRTIHVPALGAGEVHCLGWFERGVEVEVQSGLELLIDAGLGRYEAIGVLA